MKKISFITLFLLFSFCSSQNSSNIEKSTDTTTTLIETSEQPIVKDDTNNQINTVQDTKISKTNGINLSFINKFSLNDNYNSISDIDLIYINEEAHYVLTFTYAGVVKLVDKNFNEIGNFLDFSDRVLSTTTGTESGLINLELIKNVNNIYTGFISYIDKNMRLNLIQVQFNNKLEIIDEKLLFLGNQNFKPEHFGGSLFLHNDKYLLLGVGDHARVDQSVANNFSPESKILRYEIAIDKNTFHYEASDFGIDFTPIYTPRENLEVNSLNSIFLSGFRNPWNFSLYVDSSNNKTYYLIGDVGQNKYEELNIIEESELEENIYFGWPFFEGPFLSPHFSSISDEISNIHRSPDFYYEHKENDSGGYRCAIILGGVFNSKYDYQNNSFIFTDWCSSELFSLKINNGNFEFFVYDNVDLVNFDGKSINPNIIKTIENKTFLFTVNGEVFQLIDK